MNEIDLLKKKLDSILEKQQNISGEIQHLLDEVQQLKGSSYNDDEVANDEAIAKAEEEELIAAAATEESAILTPPPFKPTETTAEEEEGIATPPPFNPTATEESTPEPPPFRPKPTATQVQQTEKPVKEKSSIEKFIGENLINKIGIIILVIGAGIGVKYSIENQLISPIVRLILGYLLGFALVAVGIKLKEKYHNYSAVLVSGAMAILYFVTYSGYDFYGLIPQALAFVLMLIFTVFTVLAAIHYDRQVIAHIGLVGAYVVPLLLSDGSGRVGVLFTYIAIINIGIMILAYKKYWKSLYYSSSGFTWLIYLVWYAAKYNASEHFGLAILFLCIFFVTFYAMFLVYKLIQKEEYSPADIVPLLVNSFVFYGIGYAILDATASTSQFLGLFTLGNAIIHFIISVVIYKQKLADKNLLYLIVSLTLVFLTITIPVQLDGNWVTLLWAAEACILFAIGITRKIDIFRNISYGLMLLAVGSLMHDWSEAYASRPTYAVVFDPTGTKPLLNIHFLTSILVAAAFAFINYLNFSKKYPQTYFKEKSWQELINLFIPAAFIGILYFSFLWEIVNYYEHLFKLSKAAMEDYIYRDYNLVELKHTWIINYSLLFVGVMSVINVAKVKSYKLGAFSVVASVLAMAVFLIFGLYSLSELRETYLYPTEYFSVTAVNIWIRYVSLALVALLLFSLYKTIQSFEKLSTPKMRVFFDFVLHTSLLWIASSELIHWLDMSGFENTYKLGLSILWGTYALMLIALGIWKKKAYLRIGGIVVFGVTLVKLFFYDLQSLDAISKTIILVTLGILMLVVSFLYNKYKHRIGEDND